MKSNHIRVVRVEHRIIEKCLRRPYNTNNKSISFNNNTGFRGIYYDKRINMYKVTSKSVYIGSFNNITDAVYHRDLYNDQLFFDDMLLILMD